MIVLLCFQCLKPKSKLTRVDSPGKLQHRYAIGDLSSMQSGKGKAAATAVARFWKGISTESERRVGGAASTEASPGSSARLRLAFSGDPYVSSGQARDNPNRKRNETHEALLARARRCAPPRARCGQVEHLRRRVKRTDLIVFPKVFGDDVDKDELHMVERVLEMAAVAAPPPKEGETAWRKARTMRDGVDVFTRTVPWSATEQGKTSSVSIPGADAKTCFRMCNYGVDDSDSAGTKGDKVYTIYEVSKTNVARRIYLRLTYLPWPLSPRQMLMKSVHVLQAGASGHGPRCKSFGFKGACDVESLYCGIVGLCLSRVDEDIHRRPRGHWAL